MTKMGATKKYTSLQIKFVEQIRLWACANINASSQIIPLNIQKDANKPTHDIDAPLDDNGLRNTCKSIPLIDVENHGKLYFEEEIGAIFLSIHGTQECESGSETKKKKILRQKHPCPTFLAQQH